MLVNIVSKKNTVQFSFIDLLINISMHEMSCCWFAYKWNHCFLKCIYERKLPCVLEHSLREKLKLNGLDSRNNIKIAFKESGCIDTFELDGFGENGFSSLG